MANRTALQFDPGSDSVNDFLRRLQDLGKPQRTIENAIVRGMAYQAALRLQPIVERGVRSSPAPQAAAMSATVRAKRDRMIVIRVGAVNPRLSGWRRRAGNSQWRGSLAWGVEKGNYPGTRDEYGVARSSVGHGVARVLPELTDKAAEAYADIILEVVRRNGWPVS